MLYPVNWLLSALSSVFRLGTGTSAGSANAAPAQPPILYEFEGCPFCRKAREAVTALDLEVEIRPCPKRGKRYRRELIERGGKAQFPYLVDPTAADERYESNAIIRCLFDRYGRGGPPLLLRLGRLNDVLSSLAQLPRIGAGTHVRPSRPAAEPLRLWTSEASPGGRLVREQLSELELRYHLLPTGLGSSRRSGLIEKNGKVTTVLEDPNHDATIVGSRACLGHLERHYRT